MHTYYIYRFINREIYNTIYRESHCTITAFITKYNGIKLGEDKRRKCTYHGVIY